MSFLPVIKDLVAYLAADAGLQDLSQTRWGKQLTVRHVYKNRVELPPGDLPIILATRPIKDSGSTEEDHTIALYHGFHQTDAELAQEEVILFEEAIEAAVKAWNLTSKLCLLAEPVSSINDEGRRHPTYFGTKGIRLQVAIT